MKRTTGVIPWRTRNCPITVEVTARIHSEFFPTLSRRLDTSCLATSDGCARCKAAKDAPLPLRRHQCRIKYSHSPADANLLLPIQVDAKQHAPN